MTRSLLLSFFMLPLVLVSCTAAPADDVESTDDALKKQNLGEELAPPKPNKPPVKDPPGLACGLKNPSCTYTPGDAELNWLSPENDADRIAFGCDPAFRYTNGAGAGFLGGIFSRCPDTPAMRERFPTGYGSKYCDKCLPPPGHGKIYVMWLAFVGPNCPSGCQIGTPPEY
jgi:hypothetical protein